MAVFEDLSSEMLRSFEGARWLHDRTELRQHFTSGYSVTSKKTLVFQLITFWCNFVAVWVGFC